MIRNIKPDEGDGGSGKCFIIPPEHHHIMGGVRNIAEIWLIREESNFDFRPCPLLAPDIDLALDALGGDDAADNSKAQTRTSLQRVLLGERVEQLILGRNDCEQPFLAIETQRHSLSRNSGLFPKLALATMSQNHAWTTLTLPVSTTLSSTFTLPLGSS